MTADFQEVRRQYRGRVALVFGGSGFIGRWVARALAESGADVFITARDADTAARVFDSYGITATIIETKLEREGAAEEVITTVQPDITFNLAGYGVDPSERDEARSFRINTDLVAEICAAVAAEDDYTSGWPGAAVVHVGTALEYGAREDDLDEECEPEPDTLYGESKAAGTMAVAEISSRTGLAALTARLFTVYGPGEHAGRLLPSLIETAASRSKTPLELTAGTQKRDFTYVEDAAEGLLRLGLAGLASGEAVNIATGRLATVREFVETAARVLGIPEGSLRFGALPTRASEMQHDPVSIERLRSMTGWAPAVGIEEGITRTVEFLSATVRPEK